MTPTFRLGIVGAGQITTARHLPAAMMTPSVTVGALVDMDVRRAERIAAEFGLGAIARGRVEDALDEIDGLLVATPNHTHAAVAIPAIRAGKSVLIEKPLANTAAQGLEIVRAAESAGVPLVVGYATRFDRRMRLLKRLFDARYFGRVSRFVYQLGMADWGAPVSGYTFRSETAGGGVMIVNGSHFVDRMLWWFGEPRAIEYLDDSEGGPESRCELHAVFGNGEHSTTGLVRITKNMRMPSGFVAETEAGVLIVPESGSAKMSLVPTDHPDMMISLEPTVSGHEAIDPFQLQLENFVTASRKLDRPLVDGREGLRSLELIAAMYAQGNQHGREPVAMASTPVLGTVAK